MHTKEVLAGNYMEALLRAALLLGDVHRTAPIRKITVSSFGGRKGAVRLPQCRIVVEHDALHANASSQAGEEYLILYPARRSPNP